MSGAGLPYVLRILVTDGDPDGVRIVDKSNWTGKAVVFPRQLLKAARAEGLDSPGVYLLLGADDDGDGAQTIYIGEADDVGKRLANHVGSDEKDFWTDTIAFVSSDAALNKAHVKYLESKLVTRAHDARRATLANANQPQLPPMSRADQAEAEGFLAELLNILPAIGVDVFTVASATPDAETHTYRVAERGAEGHGHEQSDGFLVLAGATARGDVTPSFPDSSRRVRDALLADGTLRPEGDHFVLTQDTLFRSPSIAAGVLVGASINGRTAWIDTTGKTLKERQIEESGG